MTEQFYNKLLSLLLGFTLFLLLLVANAELLFLYLSQANELFYYAWLGFLIAAVLYGMKYYSNFQEFKDNLNLFLPSEANNTVQKEHLILNTDNIPDNIPLKVCLWYQQGAKLEEIKKNLGLTHAQQVKRELIKGLTFLLKFYNEHKEKEVKT